MDPNSNIFVFCDLDYGHSRSHVVASYDYKEQHMKGLDPKVLPSWLKLHEH
jgi:hypothetical protein